MIDQKLLRQSTEEVADNLARRGHEFDVDAYLALEKQRKTLQVDTEGLRNERNTSAKKIGKAKAAGDDVEPLLVAVKDLGDRLDASEARLREVQEALQSIELGLPNLLHDDVPTGNDESENQEVRRWGNLPEFDFDPQDHVDLGLSLGMLDFDAASRISGSRFAVMRGPLARLHRALIQFMLDVHTSENGYEEAYVPYLVQAGALTGTGQLPKFEEDLFKTEGETPFYLIPTAEVPLTNLTRESILEAEELPKRLVAASGRRLGILVVQFKMEQRGAHGRKKNPGQGTGVGKINRPSFRSAVRRLLATQFQVLDGQFFANFVQTRHAEILAF